MVSGSGRPAFADSVGNPAVRLAVPVTSEELHDTARGTPVSDGQGRRLHLAQAVAPILLS